MRPQILLLTTAAVLGLSACTPKNVVDFYRPAGSTLDNGDFGNATMNNIEVMSGTRNAAINLTRRFASEVPNTVNFEFDSYKLDRAAAEALTKQAEWIRRYPMAKFRVYGHTDKVGPESYNKALGLRRAREVVNYLVAHGINRNRLEAVVSFGETQPLVFTEDRERKNRRTVTEVSGFFKSRDHIQDGKYALFSYDEYVRSAHEPHVSVPFDPTADREERR